MSVQKEAASPMLNRAFGETPSQRRFTLPYPPDADPGSVGWLVGRRFEAYAKLFYPFLELPPALDPAFATIHWLRRLQLGAQAAPFPVRSVRAAEVARRLGLAFPP